jgi:hypothetical protein
MQYSERRRRQIRDGRKLGWIITLAILLFVLKRIADSSPTETDDGLPSHRYFTLAALVWYTIETSTMRINNAQQVRLTNHGDCPRGASERPDKVFLENIGTGIRGVVDPRDGCYIEI